MMHAVGQHRKCGRKVVGMLKTEDLIKEVIALPVILNSWAFAPMLRCRAGTLDLRRGNPQYCRPGP